MVGVDGSSPFAPTKFGREKKHLAETLGAFFFQWGKSGANGRHGWGAELDSQEAANDGVVAGHQLPSAVIAREPALGRQRQFTLGPAGRSLPDRVGRSPSGPVLNVKLSHDGPTVECTVEGQFERREPLSPCHRSRLASPPM